MTSSNFYKKVEVIDGALKTGEEQASQKLKRIAPLLGEPSLKSYFFEKLDNPDWLIPLVELGFFNSPPPPIKDADKGTISFPNWPETRYLSRIAGNITEKAIEIALSIPETENVRIHEDLVDLALEVPAKYSAKLCPRAISWLGKSSGYSLLPQKIAGLVKHLLEGNEVEAGFQLAENLLIICPDPRAQQKGSLANEEHRIPPEPISPFGAWEFKKILQRITSPLVTSDGNRTISLLCNCLETAVRLSKSREEGQEPEDYSYIWRGAIDSAEKHYSEDVNNILVSALRDAAQEYVQKNPTILPNLIELLESQKWIIFHRLALYLLLNFGNSFLDLISQRLTRRSLFENRGLEREYRMLAQKFFRSLGQKEQKTILDWIDKGPDIETFIKFRKEYWREETPDEIKDNYKKCWQRDRLFPFYSDLPSVWRQLYDTYVQELGEAEPLETINMRSSVTYRGPVSPKNSDDLGQMSNIELIDYLKTWEAPKDPFGPDPDGLSRQLSTLVASNPERFIGNLSQFKELGEPTYVRGLLDGFLEAKKEKHFEWQPVLDFCKWVVDKPVPIPDRHVRHREADPDWSWSRQTIIRLISSGLQEGNNPLPLESREQVWAILSMLTEDFTSPAPDEKAKKLESSIDPIQAAINTTRGEAIRLVVSYCLWIRRHLETMNDGKQRLANGFKEMPGAKNVLENHLNPEFDPSLAIRAVYGQWLPWLILIDSNWARENLLKIFPRDDKLKYFRQSAWQTYIVFCSPYDNVFEIIKDEYVWAISELGSREDDPDRYGNPDEHIAQHLTTFYWRGIIGLDTPADLLPVFYQKASDTLCAEVIEFGGRSLQNTEGEVPNEIIERFKRLWEYRFKGIASEKSSSSHPKELAAFGWWVSSKKFSLNWAMSHLLGVLKLTKKIDPDHLVLEYLIETAATMPLETIECLTLIVEGEKESLHIFLREADIREILTIVKQTGSLETQQMADDLINKLGARGYFEYRDLLEI